MAGVNRLWRIGSAASSGLITDPAAEIIEFDETPLPTKGQFVTSTRAEVSVDITETNTLKGNINQSQDGGVGFVRIYITGVVKGVPALTGRKMLLKWLYQDKTTTNFPHGRFGTVLQEFPEFNITPSGNIDTGYGWLIEDIELIKDAEWRTKTQFIITLKYNGNISGLVANV